MRHATPLPTLLRAAKLVPVLAACCVAHADPEAPVRDTPLDRYTAQRDDAFAFTHVKTHNNRPGFVGHTLRLTSQRWRDHTEVSHPEWTHFMQIAHPAGIDEQDAKTALLLIGGGVRRDQAPDRIEEQLYIMAGLTRGVVVYLPNVPNQPMRLNGDDNDRYEDDLLAESWMNASKTGDTGWIIHLAMVESAVAAMDAAQGFLRSEAGGEVNVDRFVVSGGSKRGWTSWLTAAVDDRVAGIIPIVIDTLNLPETMRHHWGAYGFWAPAIGDYAARNLARWLGTPEGHTLRTIVDPYLYRDRYTMPKFLLNAAGDQYFLPDTTRYYLDDLPGVTRLRVVPNADHGITRNPDAIQSAVAFYAAVASGIEIPGLEWESPEPGLIRVRADAGAQGVTLWQAHNPDARDFRREAVGDIWQPTPMRPDDDGLYHARIESPEAGFIAFFVEARFRVEGLPIPLTFTTEVHVLPDVLPFADKPME